MTREEAIKRANDIRAYLLNLQETICNMQDVMFKMPKECYLLIGDKRFQISTMDATEIIQRKLLADTMFYDLLIKERRDVIAELAKVATDGPSKDMMSTRIEHTSLSSRAKNLLRYQFNTIGDMVSYCDGKWRRLRALRNIGKVTYNEIMEYLGVDDRL